MLVGERMSKPVITIPSDMLVVEALNIMKKERIRRVPVVKDGKLVGIVSDADLFNASPAAETSGSTSVWEMNYMFAKITVHDVMTQNVMTVTEDAPIEQAARIMADNRIGGLPVMRDGTVVGIITEADLFKLFLEMLGARDPGVRITVLVDDQPGQLAAISEVIASKKGNLVALSVFNDEDRANKILTFKVQGIGLDDLRQAMTPLVKKILDLRG